MLYWLGMGSYESNSSSVHCMTSVGAVQSVACSLDTVQSVACSFDTVQVGDEVGRWYGFTNLGNAAGVASGFLSPSVVS